MKNIDKLKKYAELIHQKNQVMNITGFKSQEEIFSEGIINSLEAFKPFEDKFTDQNIKLLDIGAGAGFPSLPFLIANPEKIDLTILESQKKRCDFLEDVAKTLNLRLNVINNRAEEEKSYNHFFDVVTARAVSSVKNMYLMAHHLLKLNGYFYLIKGENYQEELNEFFTFFPNKKKDVSVSQYTDKSFIVFIKKSEETPKKWPLKWKNIIDYKK
ncbi:16S rRNA (guanine(527)-N(7))-methyltransferase RsmG [Mycoplasmopsis iners]|uniref:16S rRNA (guanine(527)-N(7))-methyltransferase RsmG n=1 Tax=Mycoplasmopsis iners TaxID=76630 RepID=UPI00068C11C2|nr:16S rRNA (guanine(527)-N(7))-methyltransferase RsmG [Mycoplasmopsis iners]